MVIIGKKHGSHLLFCRAHDFTNINVGWDAGIDFFRPTISPLADGPGSDEAQHVKV
jgi:hypothetical protein